MSLKSDAPLFTTQLWSNNTDLRKGLFRMHFLSSFYYTFEFILIFWKYPATNMFSMLQMSFFLTTTWNTWKVFILPPETLPYSFHIRGKKKGIPLIKGNCTDGRWVSHEQSFFEQKRKKTCKADSFHLFLLAVISCVCTQKIH